MTNLQGYVDQLEERITHQILGVKRLSKILIENRSGKSIPQSPPFN